MKWKRLGIIKYIFKKWIIKVKLNGKAIKKHENKVKRKNKH